MQATAPFPVYSDISCVNRDNLDDWITKHSWPVSEPAFHQLAASAYAKYAEVVPALPTPWNDLVLADVHFIQFVVQILHGRMVQEHCASEGISLIAGNEGQSLFPPDFHALAESFSLQLAQRNRIPAMLLGIRRRLLHNRHLSRFARLRGLGHSKVWSLGSETELKGIYRSQRKYNCAFPKPNELLVQGAFTEPGQWLSVEAILADVLGAAIESAGLRGPVNELAADLLATWHRRLLSLYPLYQSVLRRKDLPETILLGNASNPLLRTICLAARWRGAKTVTFQHGHNLGFTDADIICFNDYAVCDEFVCATTAQIPHARRRAGLSSLSSERTIRFAALETDAYSVHREAYKNRPKLPSPSKRIMLVGAPLTANRSTTGIGDSYYNWLRMDILIARALRSSGFFVQYKAHPSSEAMAIELIGPEVDEVPTAAFEDCCANADAFVFGTPLTTTFGIALCTDTPIVMIDPQGRNWNPDILSLLQRRCAFVPAEFDGANRITFDPEAVVAAVEKAECCRSSEFFETYLTPSRTALDRAA